MKYASIDIGTNTILMLVASFDEKNRIEEILDISTITRLGEGLKETGFLNNNAMERSFSVIKDYINMASEKGVDEILCVGTSALREAKNRGVFLKKIEDELDLHVKVISEREEAYYTYLSVVNDERMDFENCIIIDIGGGSTEIIKGSKNGFEDFVSIPVGSVKLTEMFVKHDPILDSEIEHMRNYINSLFNFPFSSDRCTLIGTGGTITNVASIKLGLKDYDKRRIHGIKISLDELRAISERLKPLKVSQRKAIAGLEKKREDIILQGIILLEEIMKYFSFSEMTVSANGVRFGVIFEKIRGLAPLTLP